MVIIITTSNFGETVERWKYVNPLSDNTTKWPNTINHFVGNSHFADELFECVWPAGAIAGGSHQIDSDWGSSKFCNFHRQT